MVSAREQAYRDRDQARAMARVGGDLARAHKLLEAISIELAAAANILDSVTTTVGLRNSHMSFHAHELHMKAHELARSVGSIQREHEAGQAWWTREGRRG